MSIHATSTFIDSSIVQLTALMSNIKFTLQSVQVTDALQYYTVSV
jgi:hypothetical protein